MIYRVHSHTPCFRPGVALDSELVFGARSLCKVKPLACISRFAPSLRSYAEQREVGLHTEQRLVGTTTTSNDTDHTTNAAADDLLGTTGELDTGLALIRVVADDGNVVARGTAERATVTDLLLDVGDNGTFGDGTEGEDVSDGQRGVLAGVDELAGVHALIGNEGLGDLLEAVGVAEADLGQRSTTAGVVDDILHHTADVSMSLGVVESAELGGGLVETGVGRWKS
jgi:hypothetical protein